MLVAHGTADRLVLNLQAEVFALGEEAVTFASVEAMEKAVARSIFILSWGRP